MYHSTEGFHLSTEEFLKFFSIKGTCLFGMSPASSMYSASRWEELREDFGLFPLTFPLDCGTLPEEAPPCAAVETLPFLDSIFWSSSTLAVFSFMFTMSYKYFFPSEAFLIINSTSYARTPIFFPSLFLTGNANLLSYLYMPFIEDPAACTPREFSTKVELWLKMN